MKFPMITSDDGDAIVCMMIDETGNNFECGNCMRHTFSNPTVGDECPECGSEIVDFVDAPNPNRYM